MFKIRTEVLDEISPAHVEIVKITVDRARLAQIEQRAAELRDGMPNYCCRTKVHRIDGRVITTATRKQLKAVA